MIITGYPGIGKSSVAKNNDHIIDLDSSCFWTYDKMDWEKKGQKTRPDNWYVFYCQMAESLSRQGYIVFVSCDQEVRDYLNTHHRSSFCAIFPAKDLKEQWIDRLAKHYQDNRTDENLMTLEHAKKCYESDIGQFWDECQYGNEYYNEFRIINDINYDLMDIIDDLIKWENSYDEFAKYSWKNK